MPALGVVEHLDVIEHVAACRGTIRVDPALDALPFEQLEEALRHGIVVAVAATAHAANDAMGFEKRLPFTTCNDPAVPAQVRRLKRNPQRMRKRAWRARVA